MKKSIILTALVLTIAAFSAHAQSKRLFISFDAGLPVGNTNNGFKSGFGGNLALDLPINSDVSALITAGYTSFAFQNFGGSYNFFPVKGGAKFNLADNFYATGEVGAAFGSNGGSSLILSPGIGFTFPVSDEGVIDFGARYESQTRTNFDFIGFKIGYGFKL